MAQGAAGEPEEFDLDAIVLDEDFVRGGVPEESAEARLERLRRIGRENDRLRAQGEIADGTGKPATRLRKAVPWVVFGAVAAVVIVVVALLAR